MSTPFLIASGIFLFGWLALYAAFKVDAHNIVMEVDPDIDIDEEISSVYVCNDGSIRDTHTNKEVIFN